MKLAHILEQIDSDIDDKFTKTSAFFRKAGDSQFADHIERERQTNPHRRTIGHGLNTHVDHDTSPHEMDNVDRTTRSQQDGAVRYYEWLYDNPELAANPLFPKVLNKTEVNGYPRFKVERLLPFETLANYNVLTMVAERLFGFDLPAAVGMIGAANDENASEIFVNMVRAVVGSGRAKQPQVKNSTGLSKEAAEMVSVLHTIKDYFYDPLADHSIAFDIHSGNLAWRIRGTVPELVMLDPLF